MATQTKVIEQMWKETLADGGEMYFEEQIKKKKKLAKDQISGLRGKEGLE